MALAALVATLVAVPAPLAHGAILRFTMRAASRLTWRDCHHGFECATLTVPVDYSAPRGEQVGIAVTREPAADRRHRIGALVINWGGPGDPGTETLQRTAGTLPALVRQRFDVVSFDPRGTGSSRPIDCVDDATFDKLWSSDLTPDRPEDLPSFYDGTAAKVDLVAACVARQGPWLAQVGTRNVARDLDRLRTALGEQKLNFLGYSYGTVLGAVYAQEFPSHLRTLVLDSVVDLSATLQQQQEGNAQGFEHALNAFLAKCTADSSCAFHSGGDPRGALNRLRDQFEAGLTIQTADGRRVGQSEFYVAIIAALYSENLWPLLADALRSAVDGDGTELRLINDAYTGRRPDGTYNNFQEALGVISCDDRPVPRVSFDEFRATFERYRAQFPFLGPVFGGGPIGCDPRLPKPPPGVDLGDVRATGAPPTLIIGVTHDPATPYSGAIDMRSRIEGSRVLTVESTRHGGYAQGLSCVDDVVNRYLVRRKLPAKQARCA
jgi:pimeloyl-ACP methyl ester carboxylesterase